MTIAPEIDSIEMMSLLSARVEQQDLMLRRLGDLLQTISTVKNPPSCSDDTIVDSKTAFPAPKAAKSRDNTSDIELLRAAAETIPSIVVGVCSAGDVRVWSGGATRVFWWTRHEVIGASPYFVPRDKWEEHHRLIREAHRGGVMREVKTSRLRKDGVSVPVWMSVAPSRCGGAVFVFQKQRSES